MALADIINKIVADGAAEAAAILAEAESGAKAIAQDAAANASERREEILAQAEREAEREASRIRVAARLAARDETLTRRRELLREVLDSAAEKLASMPDAEYARMLAARIAEAARGGEVVRFGSLDASRGDAVLAEVERIEPGLALKSSLEPAQFERGALVEGDRVRADLSLASIVDAERADLEIIASSVLFGEGA